MYHELAVGCDKAIILYVSITTKEDGTGYAVVDLQVLYMPYTQISFSEIDNVFFYFVEGSGYTNPEKFMHVLKNIFLEACKALVSLEM